MTRNELYQRLEYLAEQSPKYMNLLYEIVLETRAFRSDQSVDAFLGQYLTKHPDLEEYFNDCIVQQTNPPAGRKIAGTVFPVHKPFSKEIQQRIQFSEQDEHSRNWANVIKAVPNSTKPLLDVDGQYIRNARGIWSQTVCGHDEVLEAILRHSIAYHKTGRTRPLLLVGEPGTGKTLIARTYGRILDLPETLISAPSASFGRGLSGAPNIYVGAGAGAIVQAMIDHGVGNPVICIDEIEKAARGYSQSHDFQNELLAILDESSPMWFDNYLEIEIDASHIPFVFTANETDSISSPLLDRMEIVRMKKPSKEMLHRITKEFTLPGVMDMYSTDLVEFREREADMMVDMLWEGGQRSCRAYQKFIELLVSGAYLSAIENDRLVQITEQDIRNAVSQALESRRTRAIGFGAGC